MQNTYTYTARDIDNPEKVITFTLHDQWLTVDVGAPVEQMEHVLSALQSDEAEYAEEQEKEAPETPSSLWLKPLALSLIQRGSKPFRVVDLSATADEERLSIRSWTRLGGLRISPVTLMNSRVDNPDAAQAFVAELNRRKEALTNKPALFNLLNYWATWIVAGVALVTSFFFWRRQARMENVTG